MSSSSSAMPAVGSAEDFKRVASELERVLKLKALPFGMKLCETVEEMQAVPRVRRPQAIYQAFVDKTAVGGQVGVIIVAIRFVANAFFIGVQQTLIRPFPDKAPL